MAPPRPLYNVCVRWSGAAPSPRLRGLRIRTRALDVQRRLAQVGGLHHRSVKIPDLVIAAAAEAFGATVLHYDADYDRIARITGQPVEWIVPRGSR